jgi:hypothetical protein
MAKSYDDDTDFTCVRRVVWKASAPLTSEFFGTLGQKGRANKTITPRIASAFNAIAGQGFRGQRTIVAHMPHRQFLLFYRATATVKLPLTVIA